MREAHAVGLELEAASSADVQSCNLRDVQRGLAARAWVQHDRNLHVADRLGCLIADPPGEHVSHLVERRGDLGIAQKAREGLAAFQREGFVYAIERAVADITADEGRVVRLPAHVAIFAVIAAAAGQGQQGDQAQY